MIDNDGYQRVILDLSRRLRDDILAAREMADGLDGTRKAIAAAKTSVRVEALSRIRDLLNREMGDL